VTLKKAIQWFLVLVSVSFIGAVEASDSIRTVGDIGARVFRNLNYADTLNGSEGFDSVKCNQNVRDAALTLGATIGKPQAKRIVTASGTMAYIVDNQLTSLVSVMIVRNGRFSYPVQVYKSFDDFAGQTNFTASPSDTTYNGCVLFGDSIYIHPTPRKTDSLYLFYTSRGVDVFALADTIALPFEYLQSVEWLATIISAAQIGDNRAMEAFTKLYTMGASNEK